MSKYLLSTFAVEGDVRGAPATPEQMQTFMERVIALEAEMDDRGAFVFGGALREPGAASVVRPRDSGALRTDGPFVETKEQIAGFYIIDAADLDEALEWGEKVAAATNHPIEVRPFRATGRVADHMGGAAAE